MKRFQTLVTNSNMRRYGKVAESQRAHGTPAGAGCARWSIGQVLESSFEMWASATCEARHLERKGMARGGGEAVQVEPLKPKLKPPGIKRLRLKHDDLLSSVVFKFNLRRYTLGCAAPLPYCSAPAPPLPPDRCSPRGALPPCAAGRPAAARPPRTLPLRQRLRQGLPTSYEP